jgi:hypothetical protein
VFLHRRRTRWRRILEGGLGAGAEEEIRGGRDGKVGAAALPAAGSGGRRSGWRWLQGRSGQEGLALDAPASLLHRLWWAALLLHLRWSSSSSQTATLAVRISIASPICKNGLCVCYPTRVAVCSLYIGYTMSYKEIRSIRSLHG